MHLKNIICLLVDRLHIGYWGAYGNAEIETPTLDRLAAESFLADRFYVDTPDPVRQCRSWWRGVHTLSQNSAPTMMSQLNAAGYRTVLVTDDPDVAYSSDAGDFSDVQLYPTPDCVSDRNRYSDRKHVDMEPCNEIDETHLCGMLATIAATAESLTQSGKPYCLWCYLRGFDEIWDFPLFLREKYRGEDDPEPYAEVKPPFASSEFRVQSSECLARFPENRFIDSDQIDDFRQSVVSAYAGGVTMLDELLEMLIEPLCACELGNETLFLLAGSRGVLFGEHGIIGIPPTEAASVEPFASSLVQVPLAIRFPDGFGATVRSDALLQPPDVTRLFYEWLALPIPSTFQNSPNMLDLIREEPQNLRDRVLIVASSDESETSHAANCLVTPSWFLQELDPSAESSDAKFALYVKPDDRWDVNNVADRCVEIVEQLVDVRDDFFRRLVSNHAAPIEQPPVLLRERFP